MHDKAATEKRFSKDWRKVKRLGRITAVVGLTASQPRRGQDEPCGIRRAAVFT